jgi:hypothetical protein
MFPKFSFSQSRTSSLSTCKTLLSRARVLGCALATLLLLVAASAKAQFDSASVLGAIKDPSGAAMSRQSHASPTPQPAARELTPGSGSV